MEKREVFVELLGEGTSVWRPTTAYAVGDNLYVLSNENYDPTTEEWAIQPGSIVRLKVQNTDDGEIDVVTAPEAGQ